MSSRKLVIQKGPVLKLPTHTHEVGDILGLDNYLGGGGPHTHPISDITGLQSSLDGKQPLDAELTAIAGLTSVANTFPYFTGLASAALATITAFTRGLLSGSTAAEVRSGLLLGSASVMSSSAFAASSHTHPVSDIVGLSSGSTNDIELILQMISRDAYVEFSYDGSGNLTNKDIWNDSGKGTKYYSIIYNYTGDDLTSIDVTRETDSFSYTKSFTYDSNGLATITIT